MKHSFRYYFLQFRQSKYYSATLYTLIICIAIILFVTVNMSLLQNLQTTNAKADEIKDEIAVLQKNINNLNNVPDAQLNTNYQLSMQAVPTMKDFIGSMQAISAAAIQTNVNLQDFSFTVGEIGKKAATTPANTENSPLIITIVLSGQPGDVAHFLSSVKQKLPLITATDMSLVGTKTTITLQIATAPYTQHTPDLKQVSVSLPANTDSLLSKFSSWESSVAIANITSATQSGSLPAF